MICAIYLVVAFFILALSVNTIVQKQKVDTLIPIEMPPNTILLYDSELNMHIISNKKAAITSNSNKNDLSFDKENTSGLEEEEQMIKEIREEAGNLPHYDVSEEYLATPNTMVVYGSDGLINRIVAITEETIKVYIPEEYIDNVRDVIS